MVIFCHRDDGSVQGFDYISRIYINIYCDICKVNTKDCMKWK